MIPEQLEALKDFVASGSDDPDIDMWKVLLSKEAEVRISQLLDSRGDRIRKMDDYGVDCLRAVADVSRRPDASGGSRGGARAPRQ